MRPWLVRGVILLAVHVGVRTLLGWGIVSHPLQGSSQRGVAVLIVVFVALLWGGIDGVTDGRRYPDGDGVDMLPRWFAAGVFVAIFGGLIAYLIGRFWVPGVGEQSLVFELLAGACFVALLVIAPALLGVAVGRRFGERSAASAAADPKI